MWEIMFVLWMCREWFQSRVLSWFCWTRPAGRRTSVPVWIQTSLFFPTAWFCRHHVSPQASLLASSVLVLSRFCPSSSAPFLLACKGWSCSSFLRLISDPSACSGAASPVLPVWSWISCSTYETLTQSSADQKTTDCSGPGDPDKVIETCQPEPPDWHLITRCGSTLRSKRLQHSGFGSRGINSQIINIFSGNFKILSCQNVLHFLQLSDFIWRMKT